MTVREVLAQRGRAPLVIERTVKQPGHIVLGNASRPVERIALTGEGR